MIQRYWTALPGDDDYGNGMAAYACVDGGGGNVVLYADHLAEMQRLEAENLKLRGADQTVYFHGTQKEHVASIQREGFKEGTYFARHMEDAANFGGPCVFFVKVHFERPSLDGWQVVCANQVPAKAILGLRYVFSMDVEAENAALKAQIKRLSAPIATSDEIPCGGKIGAKRFAEIIAARAGGK